MHIGFPGGSDGKEFTCSSGDPGSIPAAAAAAKSLQSCQTLCDPIDGSLPGSPFPGILQARVLEWGAIAFSGSIPRSGKSPGEGNGYPLRYSCLVNPTDGGAGYRPWGRKGLDSPSTNKCTHTDKEKII